MLYSSISNWSGEKSMYPDAFKKAFMFLEEKDLKHLENGEYEIDGRNIYAIVMEKMTDFVENRAPETHAKYIDIQFMVKGAERIGFTRVHDGLAIKSNLLKEKDIVLYENDIPNESFVNLFPGDFAVFFPADVHRPLCQYESAQIVKKVVIKIAVD